MPIPPDFSAARREDHFKAVADEPGLDQAIAWLRTNTPLRRLGHMEVEETIRHARAHGFVITLPEAL